MFYLVYPSLPLLSFPISPSHQCPIRKDNIGVQILWRGKHVMRKIRSRLKGLKCNSSGAFICQCGSQPLSRKHTLIHTFTPNLLCFFRPTRTHLDSYSRVSSMSGNSQFQGAAVFKALVQRWFKLHPGGVRVVLLSLSLIAAHHLRE